LRRTNLLSREITDSENGKTIHEITFRANETLLATKRPIAPIAKANLVDSEGKVVQRLMHIFKSWFHMFADATGRMSPEGCANFIDSCTHDFCKATDDRVKDLFKEFDDDSDGFLTEDNFLKFYIDATLHKTEIVWKNLAAHYYRNDLIKETEVELDVIDEYIMPRYILMD